MAVREGLLALLADGPVHGYQLKTDFEHATGGVWALNVGQVYTTLDRLARDGHVTVDQADGQKRYGLTPSGREELTKWWQATPDGEPPPRDELILKVLMALEAGPDLGLEVITRLRTALTSALQTARRSSTDAEDLASALVVDALTVRAEADLRWLDLCEARVVRARTNTNGSGKS